MQRKIFIGIDIDVHLKKAITKAVKEWKDLPIKWHKEDGLHIALLPLGWVGEDDVLDVSAVLADFCMHHAAFGVAFEKIAAVAKDPAETRIAHAQIVRLVGQESPEMCALYIALADALDVPIGTKNHFAPHIEIGRMRAKQWQALKEYPEQTISFPVHMDVMTLTLFESIQIDGKREVVPIEVYDLQ